MPTTASSASPINDNEEFHHAPCFWWSRCIRLGLAQITRYSLYQPQNEQICGRKLSHSKSAARKSLRHPETFFGCSESFRQFVDLIEFCFIPPFDGLEDLGPLGTCYLSQLKSVRCLSHHFFGSSETLRTKRHSLQILTYHLVVSLNLDRHLCLFHFYLYFLLVLFCPKARGKYNCFWMA